MEQKYEQQKLKELTAGNEFTGFVLIKALSVRIDSKGKEYADLTLADGEGEMNAKIWNYDIAQYGTLTVNTAVKIQGTVVSYNNTLQIKIIRMRPLNDTDPVTIADFVPSAPYKPEEMMATLEQFLSEIKKQDLHDLVAWIVEKRREKLMYYPAAQANHHSVRGGLLYHTTTMLKGAKALCGVYPDDLDPDWLYAGCILHDIEKTEEMDANELGLVDSYSTKGLLLGHIVQGPLLIAEAGKAVGANDQTVLLLQHMLISHHYEPEFGAIRRPMFPEAEVLHYLDMIDARMFDFRKALTGAPEGGFTDKQWLLDNRRLYKKTEN